MITSLFSITHASYWSIKRLVLIPFPYANFDHLIKLNGISYTRFLGVVANMVVPMCCYSTSKLGKPTGIQFVGSTKIEVCQIIRATRNKVFDGVAQRGKGWDGHLDLSHIS